MIGNAIGNFEVIRQLGKGGMGEVWLAEHKDIKTKVAIKMLLPHISVDKQQVQRFFNEAVAVSKIKHAGIAKIFDVGFSPTGGAYLVMEYLEGESLAARIARVGRMPLVELADITRQIASVLEATHAEGITHRDLKPDNVYLIRDAELARGERVKVLDFGIAKLSNAAGGPTATKGSMGTPSYMSPEQWKSSARVDGRADIYSLGCLVFEMACGHPPFVADSIGEACNLHLNEPPPSVCARVSYMPAEVDAMVASMLAKQPEQRPPVRDVKQWFGAIDSGSPSVSSSGIAATYLGDGAAPSATPPFGYVPIPTPTGRATGTTLGGAAAQAMPTTPMRSRRRWPAVLGVAVVAIGGVATYAAVRGSDEPKVAVSQVATPAPVPTPSITAPAPAPVPTPSITTPTTPAPAPNAPVTAPAPPATTAMPTTSHIHLAASPANAELRIDGTPVDNPFDGSFPRNDVRHHIEVRTAGYQTASEWLAFDTDRERAYTLVRNGGSHHDLHIGQPPANPIPATKPVPAVADPPKPVEHPTPAPTIPTPPADPKPIYKGTKGTLITDDPSKK